MAQKIALVSGGTSGIGLSLVKRLIKEGYFVYFIGSNHKKGNFVSTKINQIQKECEFIKLDLSNIKEVKRFTIDFKKKVFRLDLLANIAGVLLPKETITDEGFEKTFSIAYLSSFVLYEKLQPILLESQSPQIINMGGRPSLILKKKLNLSELGKAKKYGPINAALDAIHAKTVLTQYISNKNKRILVNSFSPGPVKSDLGQNMPTLLKPFFSFIKVFMKEESNTLKQLVLSKDLKSGHFYYSNRNQKLNFDALYTKLLIEQTRLLIKSI